MIKVQITEEMKKRAKIHCMKDKAIHGFNNSKSFIDDKTRYLGSLGEEVISSYFETPLNNNKDYDIILNGERVEIKSRSINVSEIEDYYEVHSLKICIECDKYMFVIVHNSFEYAWIVGQISREKFNSTCWREMYKGALVYKILISELEKIA